MKSLIARRAALKEQMRTEQVKGGTDQATFLNATQRLGSRVKASRSNVLKGHWRLS
jgi:hypothetical protein